MMKEPVDYYEFKEFSGAVVIPIKKSPPVIVLKELGMPFYWEPDTSGRLGFGEPVAISNYLVYWKGKFYYHELPTIVKKQYGDLIQELIDTPTFTFLWLKNVPEGIMELPIPYLLGNSKIKIIGKEYVTPVKEALRDLEILKENRGSNEIAKELIELKKNKAIEIYENLRNKRNYVKDIQLEMENWLAKKYPKNYVKGDKKCEPLGDSTIRNIIRVHKKKQFAIKQ